MNFRAALGRFWAQRALRIFPAYFFWLAVVLPFDVKLFGGQTLAHLGWYLVYAQNFLVAFVTHDWGSFTHTWSLAVEQQFYLLFPLAVLALPAAWHGRFFILAMVMSVFGILGLGAAGYEQLTLYITPTTGFVFMAAGGYLAVAERAQFAFLARPGAVAMTIAALAFLAVYPFLERDGVLHIPYVALVVLSAIAIFTLMASTVCAPHCLPVRLLERPEPKFFGLISYALYIVHLPIAYWAQRAPTLDVVGHGLARDMVEFLIVAPISIALAALSFRFVETPFLRMKARIRGLSATPARSAPAPVLDPLGQ